ncbi:hypothetical protein PspLS_10802 [Pyricularia sp. CBS 133598]|nr:hypothetical protein PspLS_10802 [Pyricularia sp. CBS 133598]
MTKVWLSTSPRTIEGQFYFCQLFFEKKEITGPISCHNNTEEIQKALRQAYPRLDLRLQRKHKSIEGHNRSFNVKYKDSYISRDLSCHESMEDLVAAVIQIWKEKPPQ